MGETFRDAIDPKDSTRWSDESHARRTPLLEVSESLRTHFRTEEGTIAQARRWRLVLPLPAPNPRHRRRVRLRQKCHQYVDHAAVAGAPRQIRRRQNPLQRQRPPPNHRKGNAENPRRRDRHDLPGAHDQPQPRLHHRRSGHRSRSRSSTKIPRAALPDPPRMDRSRSPSTRSAASAFPSPRAG